MQADYARKYRDLYRHHWWWRSRESAVLGVVRRLKGLPEPAQARVLDVGCGDALLLPTLAHFGQAWGVEVDPLTLDPRNPWRERIMTQPLGHPAYQGQRYDLVTCLDVLEHIEDDALAVSHLLTMLQPGGSLVVTVPAMQSLWSEHDRVNHHHRRYTRCSLLDLLRPHGKIKQCRYLFAGLVLPKWMVTRVERCRERNVCVDTIPTHLINRAATSWFKAELAIERRVSLPFGSSLLAVIEKPTEAGARVPQPLGQPARQQPPRRAAA